MKIEHIAIWSKDIDTLKDFYVKYFNADCNKKYENKNKKFQSYFLSFNGGARIEIMQIPNIKEHNKDEYTYAGLAHFAVSLGDKDAVDALTERLRQDGYEVVGEPRTTGDGYYESVVLDADNNMVELTV